MRKLYEVQPPLQTMDAGELSAATGGGGPDYASRWWKNTKQNFHDWRMRAGATATSVATRDARGAVKNLGASYLNAMNMYREGFAPWTSNLDYKP